ncbi:PAS domain-containing protein [Neptunicoccus sediminis]|uniref:PAS domain-containing protein n=1 Tax=Neptunicoccus sediminis TaxID=1892596 RepID=UPI000845E7D9|nr:PAS domain-containing protein [Neptunicoccus sediminis]
MDVVRSRVRWDLDNDKAIAAAVRHARIPLCISDPNLPDNPIVFANAAFMELTGYCESEVIGRNCRFLQGPETTPESVQAVRDAIESCRVETVQIINYRADGTRFDNALQIGPILDDDGNVVFIFGSQLDVTEKRRQEEQARALANEELIHRLRNIVNVMSVVIKMSAREEPDSKTLGALVTQRLQALSDAHFRAITQPVDVGVNLGELAEGILAAYAPKGPMQFDLQGPQVALKGHLLSCMSLGLHEFATNSVKHGALGAETGRIALNWTVEAGEGDARHLVLHWAESGGPKVVKPERRSGSKIVNDLFVAVGGAITLDWAETGLQARVSFPL